MSDHNGSDQQCQSKTGFRIVTEAQRTEIVERAVRAVVESIADVHRSREAASKVEGGQLAILRSALEGYPEPVTEEIWDTMFKSNVATLLDEAAGRGSTRYANAASRDVMVNQFKVATMGLTLAKHDRDFAPTAATSTNLKKYASVVRPLLQRAIDPATGKPRLRSIGGAGKARPGRRLVEGAYYWLIGCKDREAGIAGPNEVLGADKDLRKLKDVAAHFQSDYAAFLYCEAKMEPLSVSVVPPVNLLISNNSMIAGLITSSLN